MTESFRKKDWLLLLNDKSRVTTCQEVSIGSLQTLGMERSMIFSLPKSEESVPYDGFQWGKTENGKRHQPVYRSLKLEDRGFKLVKCTSATNEYFKKECLHLDDETLVHYYLLDGGNFEIPSGSQVMKQRLRLSQAEDIRSSILPLRTSSSAFTIATERGYEVTRKQILNLQRKVPNCITGSSGRRVVTTMQHMRELELTNPLNLQFSINESNELTFSYVKLFPDGMRFFGAGCPSDSEFENWTHFVEDIQLQNPDNQKIQLKEVLKQCPTGVMFPSRLFVDTTYNLSDCYVTVLLAESPHFRTKRSFKPRVFPIGYLLHSHRDFSSHQFFSKMLKEQLDPLIHQKKVPSILMDGEANLQVYGDMLGATILRCDFHVLRLLAHKFGRKAANVAKFYLYGYKLNGVWKSGLLGSCTEDQFNRRLPKIKKAIDPRIYKWLLDNKIWIMETATALPKLKSGLILQYCTTNPAENFNKQMRSVVQKALPVTTLADRLDMFCRSKLRELRKASVCDSEVVVTEVDVSMMDNNERMDYFSRIGLQCPILLSFDPPKLIIKNLD